MIKTVLIYTVCWFGLVALAILNGTLRVKLYGQFLTELLAHQVSTLLGILIFGIYIWIITGIWKLPSATVAITIGTLWFFMTILFEFGFGHYVMGHSWDKLLHDYNIFAGRIWILVLIWTFIAPYIFYRLHQD